MARRTIRRKPQRAPSPPPSEAPVAPACPALDCPMSSSSPSMARRPSPRPTNWRRNNLGPGCRSTPQEAFRAQIFVDVRPVNTVATAGHLPALPLLRHGAQQAGIPGKRHRYAAPIHQVYRQALVIHVNPADPDVGRNLSQRTHAMPPSGQTGIAVPGEQPLPTHVAQNRRFARSPRAPAKFSRMPPPCPRGHVEVRWVRGCRNRTDIHRFEAQSASNTGPKTTQPPPAAPATGASAAPAFAPRRSRRGGGAASGAARRGTQRPRPPPSGRARRGRAVPQ
jgi:hypothetical protein